MEKINFNHNSLFISNCKDGITVYLIKVGRKRYFMQITKNAIHTYLETYDVKEFWEKKDEGIFIVVPFSKSKYASNRHGVWINNNAIIDRKFIEKLPEIESAMRLIEKFESQLKK